MLKCKNTYLVLWMCASDDLVC